MFRFQISFRQKLLVPSSWGGGFSWIVLFRFGGSFCSPFICNGVRARRDLHFRCRRGSSLLGRTGPLGFDRSSGSSLLGWRTGGAGNSTRDGEFFPPSTRGVSPFLATDSSRGCLLRPSAPRWDIRRSWRLRGVMGSWRGNPHSARGVRPVGVR